MSIIRLTNRSFPKISTSNVCGQEVITYIDQRGSFAQIPVTGCDRTALRRRSTIKSGRTDGACVGQIRVNDAITGPDVSIATFNGTGSYGENAAFFSVTESWTPSPDWLFPTRTLFPTVFSPNRYAPPEGPELLMIVLLITVVNSIRIPSP